MKRLVRFPLLAAACIALPVDCALAKSVSDYWQDTGDYFSAPLHWQSDDWEIAGGVVAGIAVSHLLDRSVRDHFAPNDPTAAGHNDLRDALPLAAMLAGTFAAGFAAGDKPLLDTGMDMGEAVVLGTLSTHALKFAFGRQRPNQSTSPNRFGHGGDSFPSGHTSAVFAAAQVLADEAPAGQWGWRVLAYGLAGVTVYARLDSNAHWLSDTVAGAALGMATGRFIANRRQGGAARASISVAPMHRGALLGFSLNTN